MRNLKIKRIRDHWGCEGTPTVTISPKHASFVNIKFVEDVQTLQGPMKLATMRVLSGDELMAAGADGATIGISVGHINHSEVLDVDGVFYMHGTDSGVPFYKSVHGVKCFALYKVDVVNGDVVHAVTVELFQRLGLA